jgi:histidinol-phosphate aminotransferase
MNVEKLIPNYIKKLKPYVAGKTIAEVKEQYGLDRISKLASNENRIGCSPAVMPAVTEAMKQIQDYPDPVAGKLRRAIAERNNIDESEVILAAGSESIISILCRTFFDIGDNAVTADATFVGFYVQAGVKGAELKKVPVTDDYRFDVEGILNAIDGQTKMVYIANPNNPTGTYLNRGEYERLVNGIPDDVLLIADEAYYEYTTDVEDYPPALDYRRDNVIVLRTFSKAYGLAGLRIGYGIAHPDLIREMMKTKLTFEPTAAAQAAALAAYNDPEFLTRSIHVVKEGRDRLCRFFDQHRVKYAPSISNSVMMILENEQEAIDFTRKMLEKGVILRRINAFGLPNCVRITIGREEEMTHFEESFKQIR